MRPIAYCGDHTALAFTRFGDKIYVDTRDTSLAPHLMLEGDWEPWVANAFHAMLQKYPESTVIDVGANFGWYTLMAARFGRHPVLALEPHPRLAELLRKTLTVNGYRSLVTVVEKAADSALGVQRLFYREDELGGTSLVALGAGGSDVFNIEVHADTLDHFAGQDARPISFKRAIIKIDVEGREGHVLHGARELLSMKPVLFLEHHPVLADVYWDLLFRTHTFQEIRHNSHAGPELDRAGLRAVGDAETLLCMPREAPSE